MWLPILEDARYFPGVVIALLVMALGIAGRPAMGSFSDLSISFSSTSDCVTQAQFHRELAVLLSNWQGKTDARFQVSVEGDAPVRIILKVVENGAPFAREVHIDDCAMAAKVAAVLVAVTLDPATLSNMSDPSALATLAKGEQAPPATDDTGKSPDHRPNPNSPKISNTRAERPMAALTDTKSAARHCLALWFNSTFLALPKWSPGPGIEYSYRLYRFLLFADTRFNFSPGETVKRAQASAEFQMWLLSLHTGAAMEMGHGRWRFLPQLGIGLQLLVSRTRDFPVNSREVQPVVSLFLGAQLRYRLTDSTGLLAVTSSDGLLANTRYHLTSGQTVHETGHLLLQMGIGFFHFF